MPTFLEFFAGGGMARAGLGPGWTCLLANDIDPKKAAVYRAAFGGDALRVGDVAALTTADVPGRADLAWASFPCQDLSLAGAGRGLSGERSGTFFALARLLGGLAREGRAPRVVALENVIGLLSANGGRDFAAVVGALADLGYRVGAMAIDAARFVPQSRPRLFVLAVADALAIPAGLAGEEPTPWTTPKALAAAHARLPERLRSAWVWWRLPEPPARNVRLADLIEPEPTGVAWHRPEETRRLLDMMTPLHRAKVEAARREGGLRVGGVYRRMRPDADGVRRQRAEVRFDDVAGCLRTPAGGSSRQTLMVVEGERVRSRLLSPREAARLMGLPEDHALPQGLNEAYRVLGDGVAVPAVRHLAERLIEPALAGPPPLREAAE